MRIKTAEAARALQLHPADFLLRAVAVTGDAVSFDDVWPEIDEEWLKAISASVGRPLSTRVPVGGASERSRAGLSLSGPAVHVLDKLKRKAKWGKVSVGFDALLNITHLSGRELEAALSELREMALLDHDGRQGTVSLSSARTKQIEAITEGLHEGGP